MVARVRRFNRTVTQRVGVLQDNYLARERPLGQSRVLWEIGDGADIRALRSRLDLDSGYLSRILRSLESDGLVVVATNEADARIRTVRLTGAGRAERALLDDRADDLARDVLSPLDPRQQQRLVAAMAEVERLLVASSVHIDVCPPRHPHARAALRAYYTELAQRFEDGFDPGRGIPATAAELTLPAGLLLVATLHGEPVGCGGLMFHEDEPAHIKRMWVAPAVRGMGLGGRLLAELERHAAQHGVSTVRLETNRSLTEAIAMYRARGYREVPAFNDELYAHHWFEKDLS